MQELYNCKQIDAKHYKITKFDNHLNPKHDHTGRVSSYTVSEIGCDCPQGHAQSCRHRKMLPFFIEHDYVNSEYFFVWDMHQWYKAPAPVREVREESERKEEVLNNLSRLVGFDVTDDDARPVIEGGEQLPVSAAPSPQPSKTYRRF